MSVFWYYPLHLAAFAAGIAILMMLGRSGVPWPVRASVGVFMCAAIGVFEFRISEPPELFADFYKAYYPAAKAILAQEHTGGLAETMRQGAGGFVNLPVLAWLFAPFGLLSASTAGYVFFALGLAAVVGAWYSLVRLAGLDRDRALILLLLFAANGPLHNSLREGNTTHFVLLLLTLGMWSLRLKREFLAGLIFGFAALIKLPLLLLGIYFVARGRWKVGLGGAAICAFAGVMSLVMFGWDLHVFWYEHSIKPFAETPLAAFNVQSIQGFFARLQHGRRYLMDWDPHAVHPLVRAASRLTVALLMAAVAIVIAWPRRWRRGQLIEAPVSSVIEVEVCIVVMLAMVVSMVSWSHYFLWILLPAAFLIGGKPPALALRGIRISGWVAVIGALPPVLAVRSGMPPILAKPYSYFLVSHYMFSAVLLLAVLLVAVWRTRPTMVSGQPDEAVKGRRAP